MTTNEQIIGLLREVVKKKHLSDRDLAAQAADALEQTARELTEARAALAKVRRTVDRYETTYGGMRQMRYIITEIRTDLGIGLPKKVNPDLANALELVFRPRDQDES